MMRMKRTFFLAVFLFFSQTALCSAGFFYQNFEPDNGSTTYATPGWQSTVGFSSTGEPVHGGTRSWKIATQSPWGGTTVFWQNAAGIADFKSTKNDRFSFWVHANTPGNNQDTVSVKFFDNATYANAGVEVWTTKTFFCSQWTNLYVLFSQLPQDFDLTHVTKIEFVFYRQGTYYLDDLQAIREDRGYQAFEPEKRYGSTSSEYGWKWNAADTVGFSGSGEPSFEGLHSWKLISTQNWGGTGIQSQEKKWDSGQQTFWRVDLRPDRNDSLTFWVHALPQNNMDNNLGVQFYDNGQHSTDQTKVVVWPRQAVRYGQWTRIRIPFSDLPSTLNLYDINKIQFQHYWPGTYYLDDIRAVGPIIKIDEAKLSGGTATWNTILGAGKYLLEESRVGPEGPWTTRYYGSMPFEYQTAPVANLACPDITCLPTPVLKPWLGVTRVTKLWYRVSWEDKATVQDPVVYASQRSDMASYLPASVALKYQKLAQGLLAWTPLTRAQYYEVQSAPAKTGPWTQIYYGFFPAQPLAAQQGIWYRVRGLQKKNNIVTDVTNWSVPQRYSPGQDFLRASGLMIKDANGQGAEVVLQGVNLGGYLLIEKFFTGLGDGDNPPVEDDWTIRDILTQRFGETASRNLMKTYQDSYIRDFDFDYLKDLGINMVRLPIYHRILQNDDGTWVLNNQGQIDFEKIDYVVNACADRGIYVLLDLHGAPGAQSPEAHTGRKDFNKLFLPGPEGEVYRLRTIALWEAIAERYKNNPWVCGYDLLNEPTGAATSAVLWDMYDRLYDAIRAIDPNHMIVMEAVWDWPSLPNPTSMNWTNVLYQFHYYLWGHDEDLQAHMNYLDQQIAQAQVYQPQYNVPVMIGEFHGFSQKAIWEYYLQKFNQKKWSWAPWTHKTYPAPSNWGFFNHANYNATLPKFRDPGGDSYDVLAGKFRRYATTDYHEPNVTLLDVMDNYLVPPLTTPWINRISPESVLPVTTDFYIKGKNFGATQGSSFVRLDSSTFLPIISWSDTLIHASIPSSVTSYYGMVYVKTSVGESNPALIHIIQPPSVTSVQPPSAPVGTQVTITGRDFGLYGGEVHFAFTPGSSNNGKAAIVYWSETMIKCVVPSDAISGLAFVQTAYGNASFYFGVTFLKKNIYGNNVRQGSLQ